MGIPLAILHICIKNGMINIITHDIFVSTLQWILQTNTLTINASTMYSNLVL